VILLIGINVSPFLAAAATLAGTVNQMRAKGLDAVPNASDSALQIPTEQGNKGTAGPR
jgi:hypothetical protein